MQIWKFSLTRIFPYTPLDSVHILENLAQRKSLYLHILCSVKLSLLVYLGTTFFSVALANSVHEAPNLQHWHLPASPFYMQPKVTVYIFGSVTIHLLGINTESTEFQSNFTRFKLVSGAGIRFEQFKMTQYDLRSSLRDNIEVAGKDLNFLFFFV